MFLSNIITTFAKTRVPIENLSISDSVYMRLSGLKTILRDPMLTSAVQICQLFNDLFVNHKIKVGEIKGIFLAHTSNDIAPIEVNIIANIVKNYDLRNIPFFSSAMYKCATIFKL